ncbi:ABC transporter permease [Tanticharoenia sakaeratensis]|uniref:Glycine betaine ABC transporter permease n=1 Tax=Tanticharoenia sakaeratensis NBRC 103193 TaxID=1231623 RepID=A0A0D6MIG2_9PROT|nr:ABC transporter permease subunit [Tanticharoenia sakaeratensis]GAN53444.1 glycine betaine ABC transporter permease [Tanticharoenia sakaeratensis NBRC 103193]GBQ20638.1 ABC transporter anion transporter permease [Tanticharoenia sakaeratensis NBRC 103193]
MTTQGLTMRVAAPARPNLADLAAFLCLLVLALSFADVARHTLAPIAPAGMSTIRLSPLYLPEYALRTTLRMFTALGASLVFTFTYAVIAAKSRLAGRIMIPLLDILQSTPILGFLTFTYVFFMGLFPGRILGAECAAVFVIFTSQAWNMGFAMIQSLRTVPPDLIEAARGFGLTSWQRFWRLEVPSAVPSLVWNAMMSMSGGWFMLVAAETIAVGHTTVALPGIGSYVGEAIARRDGLAIVYAIIAMALVILAYDQLIFRPLVAWSGRFRVGQSPEGAAPDPWVLTAWRRTRLLRQFGERIAESLASLGTLRIGGSPRWTAPDALETPVGRNLWRMGIALLCVICAYGVWTLADGRVAPADFWNAAICGALTLARVVSMVVLACAVWIPAGVWLGLRPRWARRAQTLAQFMAAFPANLFFPVFVVVIVRFHLNANIWLTPLMVLGTQWYILFNVVAGTSVFPSELLEAARNLDLRGTLWWRSVMLPGIAPYIATGAVTAAGGAWNASILAEMARWGDVTLHAKGLGDFIATATQDGNTAHVALGVAMMAAYVVAINQLVWLPLQTYVGRRFANRDPSGGIA